MSRAVGALLAGVALAGSSLFAAPADAASKPKPNYAAACRSAAAALVASPDRTRDARAVWTDTAVLPAALPPTPLTTVIHSSRAAMVARVDAVLYQGPAPRVARHPPGFVGPIPPKRCQVVRLVATRVLEGAPATPLVVVKPLAPYSLSKSKKPAAGTFLVDGSTPCPVILGNYGPDPYPPDAVAAALAATPRG